MITIGGAEQAGKGGDAAGNAANARAEHHRQVDDVRTRQEMAQRKGLVEFVRGHPAVLVDDAAPAQDQDAAKASQRHLGERHKQLQQPGRGWRRRSGDPVPERQPAANPGTFSRFRTAAEARAKAIRRVPLPHTAFWAPRPGTVFLNL